MPQSESLACLTDDELKKIYEPAVNYMVSHGRGEGGEVEGRVKLNHSDSRVRNLSRPVLCRLLNSYIAENGGKKVIIANPA